jgi:hypothetical protein
MAGADVSLTVARLVEERRLAAVSPDDDFWSRLAEHIGEGFEVKRGEVAILRLSANQRMLGFLYPIRLSKTGVIPLTTVHSLAVRTIRDKRGEIVNNFATYRHPTIFETVNLFEGEKAAPIQKIISAPIVADGKAIGVIEISRKAKPGGAIGPDFAPQDLSELTAIGVILGRFLSTLPAEPPVPSRAERA